MLIVTVQWSQEEERAFLLKYSTVPMAAAIMNNWVLSHHKLNTIRVQYYSLSGTESSKLCAK
jgi:hypothetical protein